ncbi:MAG: FG-GAP repeat protein [Candidatus Krumholzibacteriota bacterium]|nr:FG-GAP repeat protein [Candidatus Krumholzibacteriota bacterium]
MSTRRGSRATGGALGLAALLCLALLTHPGILHRAPQGDAAQPAAAPIGMPVLQVAADGPLPAAPPDLPDGVGADWFRAVTQRLAAAEYHVSPDGGELQAPNRAHDLRLGFTADGVSVSPRDARRADWRWIWRTSAWGRDGLFHEAAPVAPSHDLARVEYDRGGMVEWYENGPAGLEQGFTLAARPAGEGLLRVAGRVDGGLAARLDADAGALEFHDARGARVLRYDGLVAWDATGRELPSRLLLADAAIVLEVDDAGAYYPVVIDPILTTPDWVVEGESFDAHMGYDVATAGDVDGDGYSDVIIGSPDFYSGYLTYGKAWLFLGGPNGLEDDPAWEKLGPQDGSKFGRSVATAGDIDGDGYDDVLVGCPWWYDGSNLQGRVYLFCGSEDGLPASADWSHDGGATSTNFGYSVCTAGDVDGDGYDDILVGDPFTGSFTGGRITVYYGSASGLSHLDSWFCAGASYSHLGESVSTAGDVNGDGYADIIAGAPTYENAGNVEEGAFYIWFGDPDGFGDTTADQWYQSNSDYLHLGRAVSLAGDVNGDGYGDVLVGCVPYTDYTTEHSRVYCYLGGESGLEASPSWTIYGETDTEGFGYEVATAGDVNGDGYADVLLGARSHTDDYSGEGKAYLYLGYYDGLATTPFWTETGGEEGASYGAVATAGDVNGDGFSDILIGACNADGASVDRGMCYCYHGRGDAPRLEVGWAGDSGQTTAHLGWGLAMIGDVNGDGYDDALLGAPDYDNGQTDEGAAWLFLGSHLGLSFVPVWYCESNQADAQFGYALAGAGDVNGDGLADVIVGADYYDEDYTNEGAAFVWYSATGGIPNGTPANAHWSGFGGQANARYGRAVAGAGDVNGDGYADIVVGAPNLDNPTTNEGGVYGYYGSAAGLPADHDWFRDTGSGSCSFGWCLASAGDFNGDGYSDIIVGAPDYNHPTNNEGLVFLYTGSATGLQTSAPYWWAQSDQENALFGYDVCGGDFNGDGYGDVAVGAPYWDGGHTDEGAIFVWYGGPVDPPDGLPSNAAFTAEISQNSARFGFSVASGGDTNGDGCCELLVGCPYWDDEFAGIADIGVAFCFMGDPDGIGIWPGWVAVGEQESGRLGYRVAGAGDLNGDGFGDIMVSIPYWTLGQAEEGRVCVHYGNGRRGLARSPRQWCADMTTRIAPLGMADEGDRFGLTARGRTAAGRGRVRLECEAEAYGTAFDGAGTFLGPWTDTGAIGGAAGSVADLERLVTGLAADTPHHWRLRILAHNPFFPRTPWLGLACNGAAETDLRTLGGTAAPGTPAAVLRLASYPNPFNPKTTLSFALPADCRAHLAVFDVRGRRLRVVADGPLTAGEHSFTWDGTDDAGRPLAAGVYFARLQAGELIQSRKLVLVE